MSTLKVNKIESKGSGADAQHLELSTNGSTKMTVLSTGKVGIGHTAAAQSLTVVGSVSADSYKFPDGTEQSSAGTNKYSTGWVTSVASTTVADGATLTVPHNLGSADVIVQVYANSSGSDSGAQMVTNQEWPGTGSFFYGAYIQSPSSTNVVVQLAAQGYVKGNSSGGSPSTTSWTGDYIKVVVIG